MDWLLELVECVFRLIFDSARRATLRDESRPAWLRYSLATSFYVCPTLLLVLVFLSWKVAAIVLVVLLLSLLVGAMTEADDPGF